MEESEEFSVYDLYEAGENMNVFFKKGCMRIAKMQKPQIMFLFEMGAGHHKMTEAEFLNPTEAREVARLLIESADEYERPTQ